MPAQVYALTVAAALGCGLIGGVFFAFSTFIMKALARLPHAQGVAAMQSINVVVLNAWFLGAFFGTAALCVLAIIAAFVNWTFPQGPYLLAASIVYLVGSIGVTMAFNVPRNNALAAISPEDPRAPQVWSGYVSSWTAWNHVRTAASLAAAALFALAL